MSKKDHLPGAGAWSYRSFYNNPDLAAKCKDLEVGLAHLKIDISKEDAISGKIYGTGWELELDGFVKDTTPVTLWFRGKGVVDDHPWIYDYLCYVVPHIPDGKDQVPALVGAVTRVIAHPGSDGTIHPAGEVFSFYAVSRHE
jgi:nitrogen fixation protein